MPQWEWHSSGHGEHGRKGKKNICTHTQRHRTKACEYYFLKIYWLIDVWKSTERAEETRWDIVHPLIYCPDGCKAKAEWVWIQELGCCFRSLTRCSGPRIWAILQCFPGSQAGSCMGSRAASTQIGTHKECQCHRQKFSKNTSLHWPLRTDTFKAEMLQGTWHM